MHCKFHCNADAGAADPPIVASAVDEPKVPLALQPADNAAQVRSLHLTPLSGLDPSRLSIRYTSPPQVQASVANPVGEVRAPVGKNSKPKQAAPRFSHLPTPLALYRVPSEATDTEEVVVPRRPAPPLPAPVRPHHCPLT